jgi:WD40 repeat protein
MSASQDGSLRQWIKDGESVGEPWRSDGGEVTSMAVCPDKTMVVSGSADGRLRLWNVEGGVVGDPWEGHSAPVRCLDWSPDTREIASGSQDGTIRRWNPNTGRQIAPPIETGHGFVYAVKYSPRGDKFASCGYDNVIPVWSKDSKLLIKIKGHKDSVLCLCWSKDGAYIFSGSGDMTIRKWQSIDGKELVVVRGHTSIVRPICLSPDECHLVSASSDCSVRIWDLNTNQQVGDPLLHDDELLVLAIPSDGRYIASAGKDKKVYVWSFEVALKQSGNQVRVRAYNAVVGIISNWPCMMATHSPTGS